MNHLAQCTVGYCTNIHAGTDLATIRENLSDHSVAVRHALGSETLPIGLWIPDSASREIEKDVENFREFLSRHGLQAYTINGFPFDNFHQPIVKHQVYLPTWADASRLQYTLRLARILAGLISEDAAVGSISTLPIGWKTGDDAATVEAAGVHFRELAQGLAEIESTTGRRIVVAIEPEPGCLMDCSEDVVRFFEQHLADSVHRRHLTVCHDVCHASVMARSQRDEIAAYTAAGIEIGKIQVSSGIAGLWDTMATGRRREGVAQLAAFAEDRYLHQTGRVTQDGKFVLAEDLPKLLAKIPDMDAPDGGDPVWDDRQWVVHFHVPIFLERFGHLTTTQGDIAEALGAAFDRKIGATFTGHLEIETYAWSVLPEQMRRRKLSDEIADEFRWLRQTMLEM